VATVPSQIVQSVGGRVKAADWNNELNALVAFYTNPPRALVYQDTTGTTVPDSTYTSITFNNEGSGYSSSMIGFDSDGMHSTVSNTSRFTAVTAGTYQFDGAICFVSNSTNSRAARWALNGSSFGPIVRIPAVSGAITVVTAPTLFITMAVSDYVELQGWQNSGGNLATSVASPGYSYAQCSWVSS